jgi:hypothetical protein
MKINHPIQRTIISIMSLWLAAKKTKPSTGFLARPGEKQTLAGNFAQRYKLAYNWIALYNPIGKPIRAEIIASLTMRNRFGAEPELPDNYYFDTNVACARRDKHRVSTLIKERNNPVAQTVVVGEIDDKTLSELDECLCNASKKARTDNDDDDDSVSSDVII